MNKGVHTVNPFPSKRFPIGVRQSKIYKCPEHSFEREGVNRDTVFDVVNPFPSKRFPIDE